MPLMRIAVLCGGESSERDVSRVSGWASARALTERQHEVWVIDPSAEEPILARSLRDPASVPQIEVPRTPPSNADQPTLRRRTFATLTNGAVLDLLRDVDVTFLAMHGGWGEDGHLQALLEMAGVRFTGAGSSVCAAAWRKDHTSLILRDAGVPVAEQVRYRPAHEDLPVAAKRLIEAGPVVVKPTADGSSVSVRMVNQLSDLVPAHAAEDDLVIEPFLPGREFTVSVVGGLVLPVAEIELRSALFDYEAKYQPGLAQEVCPAAIDRGLAHTLQDLAVRAHGALGFGQDGYCRVDFRCDAEGSPMCLEVNALPGLTPNSLLPLAARASGITFPDLVERLVGLALR
ncbi:D-alanine--D-alanine ligase family protein [Micromonospora sp. DT4]|uniref:D-alanine--D-alanine ligase family protein n=1 Tax=Micromonospora sp. DT4 TaxID=3393438 RepID=UPI003CF5B904